MALPRGPLGLSAVCDCGISLSYSLSTIFVSKPVCMYIAYEVRISCKGLLSVALFVYCYLENKTVTRGCIHSDVSIKHVTAPVLLTESMFM